MFKITSIATTNEKSSAWSRLMSLIYKTGGALEVLALLALWLIIFSYKPIFGDYTREEIITYIVIGNIIGLISGFFLQRVISRDIIRDNPKALIYKPLKYFFRILPDGLIKFFLPFIVLILFYVMVMLLFVDSFVINLNIQYLTLIIVMAGLAFITEYLLAYLINLYIFWTIESRDFYSMLIRLKKFLSGDYFPLSLLPFVFLQASLFLPFAYSFFVPTQLYLKKITLREGLMGLGIQTVWILILYIIIRMIWQRKMEEQKSAKTQKHKNN